MRAPGRYMAALLVAASILSLAGCGDKPEAAPAPPSATPATTASPEPTPASTPEPMPVPTPEPIVTPNPNVPVITISGATEPSDMQQYNVADLRGIIKTSRGQLTCVCGRLTDERGETVQEYTYIPYMPEFSLAGTLNADMHFGDLPVGTYTYRLSAAAENGAEKADAVLIEKTFTVSPREQQSGKTTNTPAEPAAGTDASHSTPAHTGSVEVKKEYKALTTYDSGNAGRIWNYFIEQLENPYSTAAILACIETESGCNPERVEGDFTTEHYFSQDYTESVDNGSISREAFIKYLPKDKCGHGYGLCQWTGERKGALYDLAQERGTSVGDVTTQCEFMMQELTADYPELLEYLKTADDEQSATLEFSRTYLQTLIYGGRTTLAKEFLDKYALA